MAVFYVIYLFLFNFTFKLRSLFIWNAHVAFELVIWGKFNTKKVIF